MHKPAIVKEACWALSNVTAGTKEQVDAVIASGSVQELIRLLDEGCGDVKREALWAISNAASSSESTQCAHLVQLGCLSPMVTLLQSVDARVVMVALEGLKAILAAGVGGVDADMAHNGLGGYDADSNPYALEVEKAGGLDAIENLQNHTSSDVQERAVHILTTFFEVRRRLAFIQCHMLQQVAHGGAHSRFSAVLHCAAALATCIALNANSTLASVTQLLFALAIGPYFIVICFVFFHAMWQWNHARVAGVARG